ncbi:hypothetical protein RSOL_123770 [Rhizoctonia solani AG-3 Rhs1AP]|uniref:Uncharacterized protein n=1 Tax=Rhizoctonia solani AG-3 Rhs1AP TaxID=1086054 RepID=X8J0R1_9AGAM|nr:hypothetical protein RSOL_123770 [Rhizoctonia solani AG-3 Rhs1AP]
MPTTRKSTAKSTKIAPRKKAGKAIAVPPPNSDTAAPVDPASVAVARKVLRMFTYANLPPTCTGSIRTRTNFNGGHQSVPIPQQLPDPAAFLASGGDAQDHISQQASISQTHSSNHCRGVAYQRSQRRTWRSRRRLGSPLSVC